MHISISLHALHKTKYVVQNPTSLTGIVHPIEKKCPGRIQNFVSGAKIANDASGINNALYKIFTINIKAQKRFYKDTTQTNEPCRYINRKTNCKAIGMRPRTQRYFTSLALQRPFRAVTGRGKRLFRS